MEGAAHPALSFAGLLRQLRAEARLTQEELAEAAGLSPRSISDLERGINRTARKETALLLAGALGLDGQVRTLFVAAARGRAPACEVLTARDEVPPSPTARSAVYTRSTGWQGAARPPWRCTRRTGWPPDSPTASSSFRCTPIPLASSRSARPTRWPACCSRPASPCMTSRPAARKGPAGGATTSRARRSFWYSTTRPDTSRSGRCCRAPPAAWA